MVNGTDIATTLYFGVLFVPDCNMNYVSEGGQFISIPNTTRHII